MEEIESEAVCVCVYIDFMAKYAMLNTSFLVYASLVGFCQIIVGFCLCCFVSGFWCLYSWSLFKCCYYSKSIFGL